MKRTYFPLYLLLSSVYVFASDITDLSRTVCMREDYAQQCRKQTTLLKKIVTERPLLNHRPALTEIPVARRWREAVVAESPMHNFAVTSLAHFTYSDKAFNTQTAPYEQLDKQLAELNSCWVSKEHFEQKFGEEKARITKALRSVETQLKDVNTKSEAHEQLHKDLEHYKEQFNTLQKNHAKDIAHIIEIVKEHKKLTPEQARNFVTSGKPTNIVIQKQAGLFSWLRFW